MMFKDWFPFWQTASLCPFCGKKKSSQRLICPLCRHRLQRNSSCQFFEAGHFKLLVAAPYTDPFRKAVLRFKYAGQTHLAPLLAHLMLEVVLDYYPEPVQRPSLITWVPGDRVRSGYRGYHPAQLLGTHLAESLGITPLEALKRSPAPPQTSLEAQERRRHLSGAFQPGKDPVRNGKTIFLIDDVVTTGSTLEESARVLYRQGAGDVIGLAFAGGSKLFEV